VKAEQMQAELVDQVLAAIAGALEVGEWSPPWHQTGFLIARNARTHAMYRGGNQFALALRGGGWWATFNQWSELGATVRKGVHGAGILVPRPRKKNERDDEEGTVKTRIYWGSATVFHHTQVDGWLPPESEQHDALEVEGGTPASILWEGLLQRGLRCLPGRPSYSPGMDVVHLPPVAEFKTEEGWYSTAFHEATHWTGHPSRLDRPFIGTFGSPDYALEELVAEFGSALVCSTLNIPVSPRTDHLAYLKHWAQRISADHTVLWKAMTKAQQAATYLNPETTDVQPVED
jgi:antirestriction protein ArdC